MTDKPTTFAPIGKNGLFLNKVKQRGEIHLVVCFIGELYYQVQHFKKIK